MHSGAALSMPKQGQQDRKLQVRALLDRIAWKGNSFSGDCLTELKHTQLDAADTASLLSLVHHVCAPGNSFESLLRPHPSPFLSAHVD